MFSFRSSTCPCEQASTRFVYLLEVRAFTGPPLEECSAKSLYDAIEGVPGLLAPFLYRRGQPQVKELAAQDQDSFWPKSFLLISILERFSVVLQIEA